MADPTWGENTICEKTAIWSRVDLERLAALEMLTDELDQEQVRLHKRVNTIELMLIVIAVVFVLALSALLYVVIQR